MPSRINHDQAFGPLQIFYVTRLGFLVALWVTEILGPFLDCQDRVKTSAV